MTGEAGYFQNFIVKNEASLKAPGVPHKQVYYSLVRSPDDIKYILLLQTIRDFLVAIRNCFVQELLKFVPVDIH